MTAVLAYDYVKGMQGEHENYVQVIASPKHFDAYGGATTRGHRSPTEVSLSWRDWQETFLPQFHAAIAEVTFAAAYFENLAQNFALEIAVG